MQGKNVYQYDDMKRAEHMAVRGTVGWYLWTHQLMEVTGADATAFLDRMCPAGIGTLKVGTERYTTMLDETAEIIDDVVVLRMEEQRFWISTLFLHSMRQWFDAHKGEADVAYRDITGDWDMYAVQGPLSRELVNGLVKDNIDDLKFFNIRANELDGTGIYVNRAGFTGEKLGYELYIPADKSDEVEEKLRAAAERLEGKEVSEFQVMAWTLPTEAGFYYMRDLRHTNPLEVGLDRGINWDKEFIGKEALEKIRQAGPAREMVGFTVDESDIHIKGRHLGSEGEVVLKDGLPVGRCAKIVYSYVQEKNNGYILAAKGALQVGDRVTMHGHEAVITEKSFLSLQQPVAAK